MSHRAAGSIRGFTLIEVLIALVVVALGIGALLSTLTSSADTVIALRERSFAEWVALNRISELRLQRSRPQVGSSNGDVEYAGTMWHWEQVISDPEIAGILRVDVSVGPPPEGSGDDKEFQSLITASGFLGTAIAPASGIDPDWSLDAAQGPGPAGGGDGPPRGGGQPFLRPQ